MKAFHSKVDLIYEKIKNAINDGEYKPNDRLVISKIAKENDISYIPVREAIRMLESDGLVTVIPNVGPIVTELRPDDMKEHFMIRGLLEGYATRLSVDYLGEEDFHTLESILEKMKEKYESNDMKQYSKLNKEFHDYIYSSIPQKGLYKMIQDMWEKWERTRSVFMLAPERSWESLIEHEKILQYMKEKKYDELEMLVREHRNRTAYWLLVRQEQQEKNHNINK